MCRSVSQELSSTAGSQDIYWGGIISIFSSETRGCLINQIYSDTPEKDNAL